jgi:hypothetical protein
MTSGAAGITGLPKTRTSGRQWSTPSFEHDAMAMKGRALILTDAVINLVLGLLLLVFPESLVQILGIPPAESAFYPSILGAVLFGIGLALLLNWVRRDAGGLGLGGAIAINLCAGIVLAFWLVAGNLDMPLRGSLFLWAIVVLLL